MFDFIENVAEIAVGIEAAPVVAAGLGWAKRNIAVPFKQGFDEGKRWAQERRIKTLRADGTVA